MARLGCLGCSGLIVLLILAPVAAHADEQTLLIGGLVVAVVAVVKLLRAGFGGSEGDDRLGVSS